MGQPRGRCDRRHVVLGRFRQPGRDGEIMASAAVIDMLIERITRNTDLFGDQFPTVGEGKTYQLTAQRSLAGRILDRAALAGV